MDQVRTIVLAIWQQRFWGLSVIGLLVAVYCWNSATTDLESRFTKRKSEIDTKFNMVTQIKQETFHPNEDVNNGDKAQVEAQKAYVGELWTDLYQQQKNEVLFWPKLKDGFAERMEKKQFLDSISNDDRDKYRNYIKNQFDELVDIVKARKTTTGSGSSSFGGGEYGRGYDGGPATTQPKDEANQDYMVDWLDQTNLSKRLVFTKMPSPKKIWVIQEDLWVYKTLLNVIAKTNQLHGATRPDNTAIRTIIELQVGKDATQNKNSTASIYIPAAPGSDGGMDGPMRGGGEGEYAGGPPGGYNEGGADYGNEYGITSGVDSDAMILEQRYLDEEGAAIPGDSEDFGTEYRKLPIRMVLQMDQRMIPLVLVECANATLPIEVTSLNVNLEQSNTTGFTGRLNRSRRDSSGGLRGINDPRKLSKVEIQGVVLIYEPPDESVLPDAEETEETEQPAA